MRWGLHRVEAAWPQKSPACGEALRYAPRGGAAQQLVAVAFPVVMNAHFVAYGVMLIRLGGSDRAQGDNGCCDGENDFLHYRIRGGR